MPTIKVNGFKIEITDVQWRLFDSEKSSLLFEYVQGNNRIFYESDYGGLPGKELDIDSVHTVLVGYHQPSQCWKLGLYFSKDPAEKPTFRCLVSWPESYGNYYVEDVRYVARALAKGLQCPLKVFGEKKRPIETDTPGRSGVTGPLGPHLRQKIGRETIRQRNQEIEMPIKDNIFSLGKGRNGLVLKMRSQVRQVDDVEAPVFNLCEFNTERQRVKLVPPTGLLGDFVSTHGFEMRFNEIHNVEYRYTQEWITVNGDEYENELSTMRLCWSIYLTLTDESLLLVQSVFIRDAELMQTKEVSDGDKFATNSAEGIHHFQAYLAEEEEIDVRQIAVENAAYVIAGILPCHMVITEIEL